MPRVDTVRELHHRYEKPARTDVIKAPAILGTYVLSAGPQRPADRSLAKLCLLGKPLQGHRSAVSSLITFVGPQGQVLLATGGKDRNLRVWDALTRQCLLRIVTASPLHALFAVRGDRAGTSGLLVGATAGFAFIDIDLPE